MARLNKTQQYAILWLNSIGKSVDTIAEDLGIETRQINKVLERAEKPNTTNNVQTVSSPVGKSLSKDLMIRHTATKKNNSVAIMTKEASELNDQSKQINSFNPKTQKHIFRPNG